MKAKPKPTRKMAAVGVTGALTTVVIAVADALGVTLSPQLATAIAVLLAFAAGYLRTER